MGIKDELLSQLPKLALMAMAGKAGGLPAVSAFMGGQRQGEFQQGQLQRQAMLDQRMLDADARAAEMQQAQMANMETDNARLLQQDEMLKFQRAVQLMQAAQAQEAEFATDPIQADASVQAQMGAAAQAYGVPQERLSPFIQSTAPMISARKKKQAQALYERAEKRFNPKGEHPEWESSITLQTGEQFGDVTPAQLRALFEAPAVDAMGAPAMPPGPTAKVPMAGSFEEFVDASSERQAEIEAARKRYQQADDRPPAPAISIVMGPEGPLRVNRTTGESQSITSPTGAPLPPPLTEEQRNLAARRDKLIPAIAQMEALGAKLITKVGPAQRAEAIKRGAEAIMGNDPEFRTYQDARVALAGNLAVAQQGSRPSDADIRAVWLPLVPDVFRDTKESAEMKWNMIRTNMSLPTTQTKVGKYTVTVK